MKIKSILIFLISLTLVFSLFPVVYTFAKEDNPSEETDAEDLEDRIEEYEEKLEDLGNRAKTLSNEIGYMNSQIELTELRIQNSVAKIAETEKEIARLSDDIDDLGKRIDKLVDSIEHQKVVLNARFREQYKIGDVSPLVVLLDSISFSSLLKKAKYLEVMEYQDNKLLEEMENVKKSYNTQKRLFEDKKLEEEALQRQLEAEKSNLDAHRGSLVNQQNEKKRLLEITHNDEEKYQELLEDARRELNQILNAVSVLKNQEAKEVKKGEIIGIQGNTGFSFGEHLHFGVYKYSSFEDIDGWNWYYSNYVDPLKLLESKSVYWDTGCESAGNKKVGKGDWEWPIDDPVVSQGFGHTCWSDIYYGGKDHPALDMYGSSGSYVRAADSGEAYFCRNCLGDGANGVFVFHDDNYMTVYWHLR